MTEVIKIGKWMIQRVGTNVQVWPADSVPEVWCREFPSWDEAVEWIDGYGRTDAALRPVRPE